MVVPVVAPAFAASLKKLENAQSVPQRGIAATKYQWHSLLLCVANLMRPGESDPKIRARCAKFGSRVQFEFPAAFVSRWTTRFPARHSRNKIPI
jgi:hypothetical protein